MASAIHIFSSTWWFQSQIIQRRSGSLGQIPDLHSHNSPISCWVAMLAKATLNYSKVRHRQRQNWSISVKLFHSDLEEVLPTQHYHNRTKHFTVKVEKETYTKGTSVVKIICYWERIRTRTYFHLTHITNKHVNDSILTPKNKVKKSPCCKSRWHMELAWPKHISLSYWEWCS